MRLEVTYYSVSRVCGNTHWRACMPMLIWTFRISWLLIRLIWLPFHLLFKWTLVWGIRDAKRMTSPKRIVRSMITQGLEAPTRD